VSVNRDASYCLKTRRPQKYFAEIFDHDWHNVARQDIGREARPIEVARHLARQLRKALRLTWKLSE
jgi:hypothetical protein